VYEAAVLATDLQGIAFGGVQTGSTSPLRTGFSFQMSGTPAVEELGFDCQANAIYQWAITTGGGVPLNGNINQVTVSNPDTVNTDSFAIAIVTN
jgi:hypothetical protein